MCRTSWAHARHASGSYGHGPEHAEHPGPWAWGGYAGGGYFMGRPPGEEGPFEGGFGGGGGNFGVRRPLRFLAYKLGLDEKQVADLARVLDELKTERAQAAVDDRRTLADFADALAGDQFDKAKAGSAGERRVESGRRVRDTLVRSLEQIHAMLNAEQRARLSHLLRTGILAM